MQEMKFRVYNKKLKKWYDEEEVILCDGKVYEDAMEYLDGFYLNPDDIDVFFATGLKDINGKEIYFGEELTNKKTTRKVIWRKQNSQIQLSVDDYNYENRIILTQDMIKTFRLAIVNQHTFKKYKN